MNFVGILNCAEIFPCYIEDLVSLPLTRRKCIICFLVYTCQVLFLDAVSLGILRLICHTHYHIVQELSPDRT